MAVSAKVFSPKEWKVALISDATNAGSTGIGSTMLQLDVDSIGMPSLNPNQVLDVRSGVGRTLKDEDFFQDNILRVSEISLAGTLHSDAGHKQLLQNITNNTSSEDGIVASSHNGTDQRYGAGVTNNCSSLTLVMQPSDVTNQQGLEFFGCLVTSFAISADANTEGGRYKFSATLQTGLKPDLASTATPTITPYLNTDIPKLSNASGIRAMGKEIVLNSFTSTIEHPAVFSGFTSSGYEVVGRGAEISVNTEAQVKYDANTKTMINDYDVQTGANTSDSFVIINNNAFGINIDNAVYTEVALSEGDIMMLDIALKSVDNGTNPLITVDVTSG
tara:strand:- start:2431 stop:3426 length:996 start_codon:yes stop_codon:yes gene_type:complete